MAPSNSSLTQSGTKTGVQNRRCTQSGMKTIGAALEGLHHAVGGICYWRYTFAPTKPPMQPPSAALRPSSASTVHAYVHVAAQPTIGICMCTVQNSSQLSFSLSVCNKLANARAPCTPVHMETTCGRREGEFIGVSHGDSGIGYRFSITFLLSATPKEDSSRPLEAALCST